MMERVRYKKKIVRIEDRDYYLRRTPPNNDAFRHSGGDRRRCTSPTVTLYLDVELSSDKRPGTEQKTSEEQASPLSRSPFPSRLAAE